MMWDFALGILHNARGRVTYIHTRHPGGVYGGGECCNRVYTLHGSDVFKNSNSLLSKPVCLSIVSEV
jgi:hypothetical protein